MRLHYIELVLFSTYAELRAERSRSYFGLLWWVLEPAMQMATFYLVFAVIMKNSQPDFVPFLLVGLTIWQWFKSCVSHGGYAIWSNLNLIRQVKLPVAIFPSVQILADTVKFFYILALLIVILWCAGYPPNIAYVALIPVLIVELIFASAAAYLVAAVVPFVPDLRFVIEQFLQILMFLSGVVFSLDSVPAPWRQIFMLNPIAELVDAARGILMHGQWPDWAALARVGLISIVFYAAGAFLIARLTPRFAKLAV
jgi:lipopolysaccharide transport system permease protein